jgi:hypothetical protein
MTPLEKILKNPPDFNLKLFYKLLPNIWEIEKCTAGANNYKLSKEFHEEINKWDTFQFGIGRYDMGSVDIEFYFQIDEFSKIIIDKKANYIILNDGTDITLDHIFHHSSIEIILYGISQNYFTPLMLICFNNILVERFQTKPKFNDLKQKLAECFHANLIEFEKEPSFITGIPKSLLTLDICRTAFRAARSFELDTVQKAIPDEFKELLKPVGSNTKPAYHDQ